jgi:hypothetical protein
MESLKHWILGSAMCACFMPLICLLFAMKSCSGIRP